MRHDRPALGSRVRATPAAGWCRFARLRIDHALPRGGWFIALERTGSYRLTGITEVAETLPIRVLLDRGWPDDSYPAPLTDSTMAN